MKGEDTADIVQMEGSGWPPSNNSACIKVIAAYIKVVADKPLVDVVVEALCCGTYAIYRFLEAFWTHLPCSTLLIK